MEKVYFSEKKHGDFALAVVWHDVPAPRVLRTHITYLKGGLSPEIPPAALRKTSTFSEKIIFYLKSCVAGAEIDIDDSLFELSALTDFQKNVLTTLRKKVPAGKVIAYSKLAELAACPLGARPVGSVMRENPFPLYFPCHRVIKADSSLGEYQPGQNVKKHLLEKENVLVNASGKVDFKYIIQ